MKIAMIGSGYVGLVSGVCFADFGYSVTCIDKDVGKIERLQKGEIPIFEPGLQELVTRNVKENRLSFSTDFDAGVRDADLVFIAVGTPSRRGDGHSDLNYVFAAAREIALALNNYTVVAIKSTVPVGTGDKVDEIIRATNPNADYAVVSNPEFLREGAAIEDFKRPDRVVVGVHEERARLLMEKLYRPLSLNRAPVMFTDRRSSELIKYAANAFLATKIAFINEMADLCERAGADVQEVAKGIGLDRRIGSKFLNAGPGFGGSCFPKDSLALIKTGNDFEVPMRIVDTVSQVNEHRKRAMGRKVIKACGGNVAGRRIAVLGLTFKPNTDDMRDAPSIAIIQALQDAGATVCAYDPEGMNNARGLMSGIEYAPNAYACLDGADAMVLITEWDAFRALDLVEVKKRLKTPLVVDLRNVYPPEDMLRLGIAYVGIGRGRTPEGSQSAASDRRAS
jgi:UDPglucose 6-dehydrogenase